jgi:hypothetical protein
MRARGGTARLVSRSDVYDLQHQASRETMKSNAEWRFTRTVYGIDISVSHYPGISLLPHTLDSSLAQVKTGGCSLHTGNQA